MNPAVAGETRIPANATDENLRKKVEIAFNEQIHALRDYREANNVSDFSVVLLPPGGIMSVERTSKTKRIIDNRK